MNQIRLVFLAAGLCLAVSGCSGGGDGGSSCVNSGGCAAGEFCNFTDLGCGQNGRTGKCEPAPASCDPAQVATVCSCSGIAFFNECFASAAGQSIRSLGECP